MPPRRVASRAASRPGGFRHYGRVSLTGVPDSRPIRDRLDSTAVHGPLSRRLPGADSVWWLALVSAAFTLVQLASVPLRLPLGTDEVIYATQVSAHVPTAWFDPARARGVPLLIAPVTAITNSGAALRLYLAVLSGLALFGALMVWRRLRPTWVLALAGLVFGGLWVVQYYGPRAAPDLWVGLGAVATLGYFLRLWPPGLEGHPPTARGEAREAQARRREARVALAGLGTCLALVTLMRPGDAVWLALPLAGATLVVRRWRHWPALVAIAGGLVAGGLEWVIEAYARFGGFFERLHAAAAEQAGFGLHAGILAQLRSLNGPVQCRPCTVPLQYPALSLWWFALPVLAICGVLAARQSGRLSSSALPALCGLSVAVQYLFLIGYAAPRFLIPAYALLSLPVADALAWLLTGLRHRALRVMAQGLVGISLVLQLVGQHVVLVNQVASTMVFHSTFERIAADLRRHDVRPPCLVNGYQAIPIAFYAGCASAPSPSQVGTSVAIAIMQHRGVPAAPGYGLTWTRERLSVEGKRLVVYLAHIPQSKRGPN